MINPLLGVACADALGMPFEMMKHNDPRLLAWDGESFLDPHGSHLRGVIRAGQWTDDTQMTLCLAEALIEARGYDLDLTAKKYLAWYQSGLARGTGPSIKAAMEAMARGARPEAAGVDGATGTGTAMRAIPLGVYPFQDAGQFRVSCRVDAQITHRSPEAVKAATKVAELAQRLLHPADHWQWLRVSQAQVRRNPLTIPEMIALEEETALTQGTGLALYAAANHCFFATDSFKDAIRLTIRMGGDTDTRGAIVGGWAGIRYGVPADWARQVEDHERILDIEAQLLGAG